MIKMLLSLLLLCLTTPALGADGKDPILSYTALEKPFRIQKLNVVWDKARINLAESKLKMLHFELKIQDKEEIALKKLKADVGDNDGLREAEVRKKFNGILNNYGLAGGEDVFQKDANNKRIFKVSLTTTGHQMAAPCSNICENSVSSSARILTSNFDQKHDLIGLDRSRFI